MGIGLAMTGEISAAGGRITQTNFHTFQVPRITDAPVQVDVHIVESDALPGGVGEPGLPPIVPADQRYLCGDGQAGEGVADFEDEAGLSFDVRRALLTSACFLARGHRFSSSLSLQRLGQRVEGFRVHQPVLDVGQRCSARRGRRCGRESAPADHGRSRCRAIRPCSERCRRSA